MPENELRKDDDWFPLRPQESIKSLPPGHREVKNYTILVFIYSPFSIFVLAAVAAALEYFIPGVQFLRSVFTWSVFEEKLNYFSDRSSFHIYIIFFGLIMAPLIALAFMAATLKFVYDIKIMGGEILFKFQGKHLVGTAVFLVLSFWFVDGLLLDPSSPGLERVVSFTMSAFAFPFFVVATARFVSITIVNIITIVALSVKG